MSEYTNLQIIPDDCDVTVDGEGWIDDNVVTQWQILGNPSDTSMAIVVVQFGEQNCWNDTTNDAVVNRVVSSWNALEGCNPEAVRDVVDALGWYQEQSRICRLIHSEGDAGRNALSADGGKKAEAALARLGGAA